MTLTYKSFPAKTADLIAPAISRGSAVDDAGMTYPVNLEHPDQRTALLAGIQGGSVFVQTIVALTANQIAGVDPLMPANSSRKALVFGGAPRDFAVSLAANQAKGMPVYGTSRDDMVGKLCPLGPIYLASGSGFGVGDTIMIWEA